jgi:nicotinate-nucleotide adenylyltransferase
MRVGVIGGTFDPIHKGHISIAEEVRARLDLAEVIFVPAGTPWLKAVEPVATAEQRLEMVHLAITGTSYFHLSAVDIDRGGPTHTVDTVTDLLAQYGNGTELFFILGWDSLVELPRWHEPSLLIRLCRLVAVPRPSYPRPDLNSLEADIPAISRRVVLLDTPRIDISATAIRQRVARGQPIEHLVPAVVAKYIGQHELYIGR